jgi:hypothetical protein
MVSLFKIAHFCKTPSRAWPAWRPTRDVRIAVVTIAITLIIPTDRGFEFLWACGPPIGMKVRF